MSAFLAVLLTAVKALGLILAGILVLAALALFLPVGVSVCYEREAMELRLRIGPVKILLWPRPSGRKKEKKKTSKAKAEQEKKTAPAKKKTAAESAEGDKRAKQSAKNSNTSAASCPQPVQKAENAAKQTGKKPSQAEKDEKTPKQKTEKPGAEERILASFKKDPGEFLSRLLDLLIETAGSLLRGVKICRLRVFWTVTREEASATAIAYGRTITLLNTALAKARDHMKIESEELRLEPDFTGELTAQRRISFEVLTRPITVLIIAARLIWRLLHDPVLLPKE